MSSYTQFTANASSKQSNPSSKKGRRGSNAPSQKQKKEKPALPPKPVINSSIPKPVKPKMQTQVVRSKPGEDATRVFQHLLQGKPPVDSPVIRALSASGGVMSTREIRFTMNDFFDTSNDELAPYFQWQFGVDQNLLASDYTTQPVTKVIGADLYALPKFSLDTQQSAQLFLTTVPVIAANALGGKTSAAIQTTLLLPRTDSSWVKVGTWRANKIFSESNVAPAVNNEGLMAVFSGCVLDPDTMVASGEPVQCKVVVHFSQALPPTASLVFAYSNLTNESCLHNVESGIPFTPKETLLQVDGVSNIA